MRNKYDALKQLIALLDEYEQQHPAFHLRDFAGWLIQKCDDELDTDLSQPQLLQADLPLSRYNPADEKTRFLETIARLARFHEFYIRKGLREMMINTRLEFLFLQTADVMEKVKKTDLINHFHLEYTTGMDTIRRLINNKLLYEIQDESDKRIKLLVLSEQGKETLKQSLKKMEEEGNMFLTAISDNKWKKALPALEEIETFHDAIFQKHSNKTFAELSNLIESLKHLYLSLIHI